MREAMDMAELRRGVEQLRLEDTLAGYEVDIEQITEALDLDSVEDAKAANAEVLRRESRTARCSTTSPPSRR